MFSVLNSYDQQLNPLLRAKTNIIWKRDTNIIAQLDNLNADFDTMNNLLTSYMSAKGGCCDKTKE